MRSCNSTWFWKLLLVLLALAMRLHGQSGFAVFTSPPKPDPDPSASQGLARAYRASVLNPGSDHSTVEIVDDDAKFVPPEQNADDSGRQSGTTDPDHRSDGDSKSASIAVVHSHDQTQPDFGRDVYYKNKLEFALDSGWLPINIPFPFDIFLGDGYNKTPLNYTLVPLVASLRWHMDDVSGPWIFRGNWDMTFSGSITFVARGPETRYYSYDMGIRRNFVPHRGKIAPYFDGRLGLGRIDAKEPLGVVFGQGQNFTFTMNLGAGARYNFNPQYSFSAGLHWMHISNLYLSEPAFSNYGINVWGPMFGIDVRLRKPRHASE